MTRKTKPTLSIIVPCFNEELTLSTSINELSKHLEKLKAENKVSKKSFIIFVDDGSDDNTIKKLKKFSLKSKFIKYISLEKNYGHQIALISGMDYSCDKSDVMITIDCDLQQEISAMKKFLISYEKGHEIVLGVRKNRKNDGLFKAITAKIYHFVIVSMGIKYVQGHADYRLVSTYVYKKMQKQLWTNKFLRSSFSNTEYNTDIVGHEVFERLSGSSKYSLNKMFNLALEGIFSNSTITIRFFGVVGLTVSIISFLLAIYGVFARFFLNPVEGWSSVFILISFFGGIIVFSQCLLAEILVRLFKESLGEKPYNLKSRI